MAGKPQNAYPPNGELAAMVERDGVAATARFLDLPEPTLRSHLVRQGLPTRKGVSVPNGAYVLDDVPAGADLSPDRLLRRIGLDPEEWIVTNVRAREGTWGDPEKPNEQLRLEISVAPRAGQIRVPDLTDWKPLPKPKARKRGSSPLRAVVIGDHHAPRHERTFHALFVEYLRRTQPDLIDVNGDLLDFPSVGRHRTREEYNHDVSECLRAGLGILRDYRDACPDARIRFKRGNHDARLEFYVHDNAPEVLSVAPGGGRNADGEEDPRPWHSLDRLLYLDELHIEYVPEDWEQAKTNLSRKLTTRHGFSTSPSAGKAMLDKLSGSTIQGHDHRLALNLRTRHTEDPDDPLEIRLAMSGGCACQIPGGLGYVTGGEPDWQNAAVQVDIYDDGNFYALPMLYLPGDGGQFLTPEGRLTP